MKKSLILAAAASLVLFAIYASPAHAFQVGVKGGWHTFPKSSYLDHLSGAPIDSDTNGFDGPVAEVFVDFSILPMVSLEMDLGGYTSSQGLGTYNTDLTFDNAYVLLTPKFHFLPLGSTDIYAGLGVGYYLLDQSVNVEVFRVDTSQQDAFGFHGTLGVGYQIARNFYLLGELRYAVARINNADGLGHDLDVGGAFIQLGAAITW